MMVPVWAYVYVLAHRRGDFLAMVIARAGAAAHDKDRTPWIDVIRGEYRLSP